MPLQNDLDRGAHLLRRFGLGMTEAELAHYMRGGLDGAVEMLTSPPEDPVAAVPLESLSSSVRTLVERDVVNGWILRMLKTHRPLEERMTLFWHNHFATSLDKVDPATMYDQNGTLRTNALEPFPKLLEAVSKDPAMLKWLDNTENVRGRPNENFAREVMELFTLGIGNYTEEDVREGARAFTGWATQYGVGVREGRTEFLFRPSHHDNGMKTFLGRTGPLSGEDVLRTLCEHPRTAEFLVAKLWNWFVWPDPDSQTLAPFVERYHTSGLDTKALLRDIMLSPEFYSPKARRAIVKSPVDIVIVTMRQFGIGECARKSGVEGLRPAYAAQLMMKEMGMWLMNPFDVSGWKNGRAWITSATMSQRIVWGEFLFGQGKPGYKNLPYVASPTLTGITKPDELVGRLEKVFDVRVSPERRAVMVVAAHKASSGAITPANLPKSAAAVARLMFASPEFQFC